MIISLERNAGEPEIQELILRLNGLGAEVFRSDGQNGTVLALTGDVSEIDDELIRGFEAVSGVTRISEPYKTVGRKNFLGDAIININGRKIGGGNFQFIAGPCAAESYGQIVGIARAVKAAGAGLLRGGAFKPRTSPYAFQGLREKGLELLSLAKAETGLPTVSEITDVSRLPLFEDVDVVQVGARNMQNFELLDELGRAGKPVLLKRGLSASIEEFLLSAERIAAGGNDKIILCERGIRTFERELRNTLDISAVPVLKEKSRLPVIVDPSHASGKARFVRPLALAAAAAGADGLMIEVHNDPSRALCDGAQAIRPREFAEIVGDVTAIRKALFK